eukprot:NODE_2429_length_1119_cov_7.755140_g2018_i0.p3 GENE.NODE_2429_length_1119_cov_7.755140_g2018_i0~~NODE_2429_length_1119_cov_7.755140_g2018_i0.p3  ORF type:complete len:108 (-),score=14.62 NODE_2429_length_1119_cov_7.755140_g2018_i0:300-623(-)
MQSQSDESPLLGKKQGVQCVEKTDSDFCCGDVHLLSVPGMVQELSLGGVVVLAGREDAPAQRFAGQMRAERRRKRERQRKTVAIEAGARSDLETGSAGANSQSSAWK